MGRLGLGWLPTYVPACHRPWHSQHPSTIESDRLMETCARYESIFPNDGITFKPENTPWWTHWLIAFAVRKTTLDPKEICLLYKYKYREVIPDIDRLQIQHIVADLWDYLRDGEHEYAFEWERSQASEDALRVLLSVWLFEAYRPDSWPSEEERLRWLSSGYLDHAASEEEARSNQFAEDAQDASGGMEFLGQRE
ncbi:hypothetical protein HO173_004494 [Letharia columbiana]|uniref:Uncharacterized protein n=1 Tax=Letharia columbiana TaxID=112416 RepID=A0A8H6L6M1_9LECA|nr:uncharacterized protein HO173_004494 [Letharia columbiana]KAF6237604.1 hypothetical protein HO173_004494 [Letharia columbiana]